MGIPYNFDYYRMKMLDVDIEEILFEKLIDKQALIAFNYLLDESDFNENCDFNEINWLNTPGPIYTTFTDNCGIAAIDAINNIAVDEDYREIIFKQPFTKNELKETLAAATCDPFDGYFFDGNKNWNMKNISSWWSDSQKRIDTIIELYMEVLIVPEIQQVKSRKAGTKGFFAGNLIKPISQNYKNWLDFYQHEMKGYLEWYIYKIEKEKVKLPELNYDWKRKQELDKIFKQKMDS